MMPGLNLRAGGAYAPEFTGDQTIVEWYFKNEMNNGSIEEFDGISLVEWTEDNKIKALKEFGCNRNTYNPYQEGDTPQFKAEKVNWF